MAFKIKKAPPAKETDTNNEESTVLEGSVLGRPEDNLPGVQSVDRVVLASENAFDWMHRHRVVLIGGLAAILIGMIAVAATRTSANEARAQEAQDLYQAYAYMLAPVGEDMEPNDMWAQGDPVFNDSREQLLSVRDAADSVAAESKGGPQAFAQLLSGSVSVQLGDKSATETLEAFQSFATGTLQTLVAEVALAAARAADGDLPRAIQQLDTLASQNPDLALQLLEQRAGLFEAYGSADEALQAWKTTAAAAEGTMAEARIAERVALLELRQGLVAQNSNDTNTADDQDTE